MKATKQTLARSLSSSLPRLLTALAFVLPTAHACPVRPGTIGNGLIPTPAGLRAECGTNYQAFKKGVTAGSMWAEMYSMPITGPGDNVRFSQVVSTLSSTLTRKGYVFHRSAPVTNQKGAPQMLTFVNRNTGHVFAYLLVREGSRMTLALTGK
ncbi:hypothetical protein [Deinococcus hohokamensis]|uniref:Lipoprotein n=1 Tax=Deinococcus hohokamensis TaxID=309883 RepID=A0ABV9IBF0_9DEIO